MKSNSEEYGVNSSILNIITPSGVEIQKTSSIISDNHAKAMVLTNYPSNPDYGWLSNITNIENTTAEINFRPTDPGELILRCNEQIREYTNDIGLERDESVKQNKERAINDIREMIKRINEEGEIVGYLTILLLIKANSEKQLSDRMKKVYSVASSEGFSIRNLTFFQKEAIEAIAPFGLPNEKFTDIGERNMPLSTFLGGFPNASSGINDGIGYLLGRTIKRNKQVIIDTWRRGGDRTNTNWLILGLPGVGKSATVKHIAISEYALGAKLIFIDPEKEYINLVKNLGGDIINCAGGNGGKINPLQVRVAPKIDESENEEDTLYKDEGKGMGDLALYFQTLRTFFRMYLGNITELQVAKLEEVLEKLYEKFNITWDTDISKIPNEQFPIMKDLYDDLLKVYEETKDQDYADLSLLLRSAAVGADSKLWNGYTDMDTKANIVDLNISDLLEADEKIQKTQYYNILTWAWQRASLDRNERIIIIVDEAYLIVDPETPQALIFLRNVSKRIRKYEGGLMVITHSVVDLLDQSVKRHGQAIIDNSCFKLIMGTDGQNLEETKNLFKLTDQEESLLLSKKRSQGILFAGSKRIALKIDIPDPFLNLMGNAGGR